jgi:hypothetical protein
MPSSDKMLRAQDAIGTSNILEHLKAYDPTVVSTIFVGFDIDASDIDIICTYHHDAFNDATQLAALLQSAYGAYGQFSCKIMKDHLLCQFYHQDFLFEIYGSALPVSEQNGFRHFQVMKRLSKLGDGETFQERMRENKRAGLNTEPSIASLFGLDGDPYEAVLLLEDCADEELAKFICRRTSD